MEYALVNYALRAKGGRKRKLSEVSEIIQCLLSHIYVMYVLRWNTFHHSQDTKSKVWPQIHLKNYKNQWHFPLCFHYFYYYYYYYSKLALFPLQRRRDTSSSVDAIVFSSLYLKSRVRIIQATAMPKGQSGSTVLIKYRTKKWMWVRIGSVVLFLLLVGVKWSGVAWRCSEYT